jgi:hypothetical protein
MSLSPSFPPLSPAVLQAHRGVPPFVPQSTQLEAFPTVPNPLNWKNWNLKQAMPALILPTAVAWGLGNVLEHQLHDGHLLHGKLPKPLLVGLTGLAIAIPAITVAYGVFDALGLFLAGYGWRAVGFLYIGLLSLATLPRLIKANQWAAKNQALLQHIKAESPKLAEKFSGQALLEAVTRSINEKKLKQFDGTSLPPVTSTQLKQWADDRTVHWMVQGLVPLFIGLCAVTKVAQALPSDEGTLKHTKGSTVNQLWGGGEEPAHKVFADNFVTEANSVKQIMTHLPQRFNQSVTGLKKAIQPTVVSADTTQPPVKPFNYFMKQLEKTPTVALIYTLAMAGFTVTALVNAGLLLAGKKHLLVFGSDAFKPLVKAVAEIEGRENPRHKIAMGTNLGSKMALSAGQLNMAIATAASTFNDWPIGLSLLYRASAIPLITGSLGDFLKLDKIVLTKVAGFMQTTAYTLFLLVSTKPLAGTLKPPPSPVKPANTHSKINK